MATTEVRTKLTDKQYNALSNAAKARSDALDKFQAADKFMQEIGALVLDAKGLPESLAARIDDVTKDLVWTEEVPETPEPAAAVPELPTK